MVMASASGKVILFGEHAVVYGRPAIAMAIDKRVYVETNFAENRVVFHDNEYIKESVNLVLKKAEEMGKTELKDYKIDIKTKSELPVSSGLGSSGALSVALIKSLSMLLGLDLDNEDIAKMGWEVERNVQGFASGIDPFVSTYGGIIYYKDGRFERLSTDGLPDLNFLIIHSGKNSATKEMVKKVANLKKEYPVIINKIFDAIEVVTEEAVGILHHMKKGERLKKLGSLMNINQGLLESLGVSTPELTNLFYESLKSGALGAKLTGSGGGGCLISLYPPEKDVSSQRLEAYESPTRNVSNLRFEAYDSLNRNVSNIFKDFVRLKCRISPNGVRIEE